MKNYMLLLCIIPLYETAHCSEFSPEEEATRQELNMDPATYRELLKWQRESIEEKPPTQKKNPQPKENPLQPETPFFTREELALRAQKFLKDFNRR